MATSQRCSICQKGAGHYFCTGCNVHFCKKDFQSHRQALNNELDGCIQDRNILQEKIAKSTEQEGLHNPLLLQINEWEGATIEKVKQTAELVRQNIMQILNSKRLEITSAFNKLSKELVELKETEDFAEQDLKRFKETINRFNGDLKKLTEQSSIELHMEESQKVAWNRLIYFKDKTNVPDGQNNERQRSGANNMSTTASTRQPNSARYRSPSPSHFRTHLSSISPEERSILVNVDLQSNVERRPCRSRSESPTERSCRETISPQPDQRPYLRSISPMAHSNSIYSGPQSTLESRINHSRTESPVERYGLVNVSERSDLEPRNYRSSSISPVERHDVFNVSKRDSPVRLADRLPTSSQLPHPVPINTRSRPSTDQPPLTNNQRSINRKRH